MITREQFNQHCATLKGTTHVIQWGGADVWKIGGKIFAIAPRVGEGEFQTISIKVNDFVYEILTQKDGIVPAPYLARAKWIQIQSPDAMTDEDLIQHVTDAYEIITTKLTKTLRHELGL